MLLGTRQITVADVRRYVVDYRDFLPKGVTLKSPVVTVPAGLTSTIGSVSLDPSDTQVIFYVTGGVLNETFTVTVQVQDTNSETINDTISFTVIAP